MEALLQAIFSFFMIMGIGTSILLVIGFLLKAKGVRTISREESISLKVPQATVSYCPISNNEIILLL